MPNVPFAPGVPPLSSYAASPIIFLVEDAIGLFGGGPTAPQWGIFLDGEPAITVGSTNAFSYEQAFEVSEYPQEQGAFISYNKAQRPAVIRVRMVCGGSVADRQQFLASIDAIMNDTKLYDVVTPEQVFLSYNLTHRDYQRNAVNGVGLIAVSIWLKEIRETGSAEFQNTQQPGNAGQLGLGNVQATTPTQSEQQLFSGNWQ